jgi:hypothetical protein
MRCNILHKYTEEIKVLDAIVRVDVYSEEPIDYVLEDEVWLSYRLASAKIMRGSMTKAEPDLVLFKDVEKKDLSYDGKTLYLYGKWLTGEIQRLIVSLAARELEKLGIFPLHSTAFHYRGRNILLLSSEANHGKTMTLIEALHRGAEMISGETTLIDFNGNILAGSKEIFLKARPRGTERSDLPGGEGWRKFFKSLPDVRLHEIKPHEKIDLVILPDIDGNFDIEVFKISEYEKPLHIFISITMSYFIPHHLISYGIAMPIFDDVQCRRRRASFAINFAKGRDFYLVRGPHPQAIMNEVEKLIGGL